MNTIKYAVVGFIIPGAVGAIEGYYMAQWLHGNSAMEYAATFIVSLATGVGYARFIMPLLSEQ